MDLRQATRRIKKQMEKQTMKDSAQWTRDTNGDEDGAKFYGSTVTIDGVEFTAGLFVNQDGSIDNGGRDFCILDTMSEEAQAYANAQVDREDFICELEYLLESEADLVDFLEAAVA